MQFPNGVNKSNLIKLGVLGAAYYMLKGRNKSQPSLENKTTDASQADSDVASNEGENKKTTAFTMGKELAAKVLGKKF